MPKGHPEIELPNEIASRIVGGVFWDQINAVLKNTGRDLDVHLCHVVNNERTAYDVRLGTADDDGEPEIETEAHLRAAIIPDTDGNEITYFRIQCRFKVELNENRLMGFDQTGRIVDDFAVVDELVNRYRDDTGFTAWTKT